MTFANYIQSIMDYTKSPSDETRGKVEKFTNGELDRLYWYEYEKLQTFFKNDSDRKFEGIKTGDVHIWGRLLMRIFEPKSELFQKLKSVSPFAGKSLVHVGYGCDSVQNVNIEDLERKIHECIKGQDYKTHDCDDYLIALSASEDDLQNLVNGADVVWLYSGITGQENPRNADGSQREF